MKFSNLPDPTLSHTSQVIPSLEDKYPDSQVERGGVLSLFDQKTHFLSPPPNIKYGLSSHLRRPPSPQESLYT